MSLESTSSLLGVGESNQALGCKTGKSCRSSRVRLYKLGMSLGVRQTSWPNCRHEWAQKYYSEDQRITSDDCCVAERFKRPSFYLTKGICIATVPWGRQNRRPKNLVRGLKRDCQSETESQEQTERERTEKSRRGNRDPERHWVTRLQPTFGKAPCNRPANWQIAYVALCTLAAIKENRRFALKPLSLNGYLIQKLDVCLSDSYAFFVVISASNLYAILVVMFRSNSVPNSIAASRGSHC